MTKHNVMTNKGVCTVYEDMYFEKFVGLERILTLDRNLQNLL